MDLAVNFSLHVSRRYSIQFREETFLSRGVCHSLESETRKYVRQKSHSEQVTRMLQVSTGKYNNRPAKNLRSALSVWFKDTISYMSMIFFKLSMDNHRTILGS